MEKETIRHNAEYHVSKNIDILANDLNIGMEIPRTAIEKALEKAATIIVNAAVKHAESELKKAARKIKKWQPGHWLKRVFKIK